MAAAVLRTFMAGPFREPGNTVLVLFEISRRLCTADAAVGVTTLRGRGDSYQLGWRLDQALAERLRHRLRLGVHLQLLVDVLEMKRHRVDADTKVLRGGFLV